MNHIVAADRLGKYFAQAVFLFCKGRPGSYAKEK